MLGVLATVMALAHLATFAHSACSDPTYYYNQNLGYCILCSFGCLECCDENLCSKCATGYVLSTTTGLCLECPQNC